MDLLSPLLPKQHRTAKLDPDQQGDDGQKRGDDHQPRNGQDQVKEAFAVSGIKGR